MSHRTALFLILWCTAALGNDLTIAVVPFINTGAHTDTSAGLGPLLADKMTAALGNRHQVQLIERAALGKIIEEMKLGMSGAVSDATAAQAGYLLGADALLLGSYLQTAGGTIRIDARIVAVESGETIRASQVSGPRDKVVLLLERLSTTLLNKLDLKATGVCDAACTMARAREAMNRNDFGQAELLLRRGAKDAPVADRSHLESLSNALAPRALSQRSREALAQESVLTVAAKPQSVAVVLTVDTVSSPDRTALRKALSEMLTTDLSQVRRLTVLERSQVEALTREMALGETGLLDGRFANRFGKLLGAEHVVVAEVLRPDSQQVAFDASVVGANKPAEVAPVNLTGAMAGILKLEKKLAFSLIESMGITLTSDERKAIETIPTENVLALLAYGRGLDASDRGDFSEAAKQFGSAAKLDPGFSAAGGKAAIAQATADAAKEIAATREPAPNGAKNTPVFTLGPLRLSAVSPAALASIRSATAGFMPERPLAPAGLERRGNGNYPAAAQSSGPSGELERNSYIDATNGGVGSGAALVPVKAPAPPNAQPIP